MITLVVVNYKTSNDLFDFLSSCVEHRPETPHQIVVVNNEPEEADMKVVSHFMDKGVVHLHMAQENLYYSGALNRASMVVTDDDAIAFFNADTQLTAGVVDNCYELLMSDPLYAVVGPGQIDRKGRTTHAGIFGTLEQPKHRGWKERWREEFEDIREAVTVSGSAYFVKRSVLELLDDCPVYRDLHPRAEGPFLPTTHYYEETWFSYHAQQHGFKVIYNGTTHMIHEWHKATPIGGWAEQQMPISREMFRKMCDHHGIAHD